MSCVLCLVSGVLWQRGNISETMLCYLSTYRIASWEADGGLRTRQKCSHMHMEIKEPISEGGTVFKWLEREMAVWDHELVCDYPVPTGGMQVVGCA